MPNACSTGPECPQGKKTDDAQGRCCVFPFTYRGMSYDSCTSYDHDRPWCSFDAVYRGQWANCGKKTLNSVGTGKTAFIHVLPCNFHSKITYA